ncbi:MAG: hypothetical protein CVV44_06200 [Spirochaetae bacterium HGW-Spirochaetae-1]|nr:MAG: hypothetical protein CVV44_06200 [Spirochaetae bacterium HGW-Spirochaetae-1]
MKTLFPILILIAIFFTGTEAPGQESPTGINKEKKIIPVELSLYSPLEIFPGWNEEIHGVHLSLIYGRTGSLKGFSLGPAHRVENSVLGTELAFFNNVQGDVTGVQAALVNLCMNLRGFQAAVINLTGPEIRGVQLAALNITGVLEDRSSGYVDTAVVKGTQIGFINKTDDLYGAQIGFINICRNGTGCQVGLINISREMTGASLGFLNIFTGGGVDLSLYSGLYTLTNLSVRSMGKYSYGIFSAGFDPRPGGTTDRASFGFGFGARIPLPISFYADTDLMFHFMSRGFNGDLFNMDSSGSEGYAAVTIRLLPGWQFSERFSLFAGPVCLIYPAVNRDFDVKIGVNGGVTVTIL